MPTIPYPNVPDAPGVPAVPRSGLQTEGLTPVTGLLITGLTINPPSSNPSWGIYDASGAPLWQSQQQGVVLSTNTFEFLREARVSDYPTEEGSFASYNKVSLPGNPVVSLALTGNETARAAFLMTLDAACKSTDLYSVVTPDATYANYNIERYTYQRRASKGCTLLVVEISLKEIRQVRAQYSTVTAINQPQDAGATPQTNTGQVQPAAPPASVLSSLGSAFPSLAGAD